MFTTTLQFVALACTFTAVAAQGAASGGISTGELARSWIPKYESVYDGVALVNTNETPTQIEYRQFLASAKHHDITLVPWEQCINERNFEKMFADRVNYFQYKGFELCTYAVNGSMLKDALVKVHESALSLDVATLRVTNLSDDMKAIRAENEKLRGELQDAVYKLENTHEYIREKFRQFTKKLDSWGFWNSTAFWAAGVLFAVIGMGIIWWCKCRVSREERRETQQHELMKTILDNSSSRNTTAAASPSYGNTTTTHDGYAEAKYPSPGPRPDQSLYQRASHAVHSTFRAPVSVLSHDDIDIDQQQEGQQSYQPQPLSLPSLEQDTNAIPVAPVTPSPLSPPPGLTPRPGSFLSWRQNMQASRDRGRQFMAMHAPGGPMSVGSA